VENDTYVEPSKLTVGAWLTEWLEASKSRTKPATYARYKGIIDTTISKATISTIPIQKLRPAHIEAYYGTLKHLAASTVLLHHTIIFSALRKAVRDRLIVSNPARDLEGRPRRTRSKGDDARQHCWNATDAAKFLDAAKAAGAQPAAFYTLGLNTGMRKGELCGLKWEDVDLDARKVRGVRQLASPQLGEDGQPVFGPTKTGRVRTITIDSETAALLREHRKTQREAMMQRRSAHQDFGLVFTRDDGEPLLMNNLGQREYAKLITAAGVKAIKFHGLRHTCATLLLQAGTPVHVVSERLGHSKVSMTLEVYAHVLPDMQNDAAAALGALLHRR
jgi:integrase